MAQTVEISLRIPSLRVHNDEKNAADTIANNDIRLSKQMDLEAIPKPGEVLGMTVSSGEAFECEVVRSDWHDGKNMFVVACRYAKRSISHADYLALMNAQDWEVRPLLQ